MYMEKEIDMKPIWKISKSLGKVGDLEKLTVLKPGFHKLVDIDKLGKDKDTLISKIKSLKDIRKQLSLIYEEKDASIKMIKTLMNPIYESKDRTRKLELKVMHQKIEVLRKEKKLISHYQRHIKDLENSIRSGLGGVDYIKRNKDEITSFYVSFIHNSRFFITLYTGENKN